jgi:PhzF family phenazine biosynthesis protein
MGTTLQALPFSQVNVFSADPLGGNPLAVVHAAQGLSEAQMAALARWTNLS